MKTQKMTQREIDRETDLKLFNAFRLIEQNNLLYFRVLKKINFLILPEFPAIGGVSYNHTKKQIYMVLREDAMLNGSKEDVAGLNEHECGHILFEHIFNFDKSIDHALMNVSQDLIINDSCHFITTRIAEILKEKSTSILAGGCFYSEFQKKYPVLKNYNTTDLTSVQLYNLLKKSKDEEKKNNKDKKQDQKQNGQGKDKQQSQGNGDQEENQDGQGGEGQESQDQGQESDQDGKGKGKGQKSQGKKTKGQGNGQGDESQDDAQGGMGDGQEQGFDSHDDFEIVEDENGNETVKKVTDQEKLEKQKQEMQAKVKELVTEAIESLRREGQLDKAIGQLKGQMQILVKDLIKSKTDKNSIFNFLTRLTIGHKKTWTKLHHRYPYLAKGKRKNKKPKLALIIDTSGSMGSEELFELIKHQCQVLVNRCESLYIVVGDTQMEYSMFVKRKNQFDPQSVVFKGGGGTDLQFGWDFAKENKLDGVIVHTDGFIGQFDDHQIKTIFYLYGKGHLEQDGYQNIRVYPL